MPRRRLRAATALGAAALTGAALVGVAVAIPAEATSRAPRPAPTAPRRALAARGSAATPRRSATGADNLLTYDWGNSRSGDDVAAAHIATLSANPAWDDAHLDGAVYGQPLVDGTTVYVATEGDTLYALSAAKGAVLWHLTVGTPVPPSVFDSGPTLGSSCGDIDPLGITGTPVIDPVSNELFLAEETQLSGTSDWQGVRHWLVAISLTSHKELWHHDVDPPDANRPSTYYIPAEQQRPAMTLTGGRLYVLFGGLDGDCGQYHGYVESLEESGAGPLLTYEVPTAREGAIWETNGALVAPNGDLYVATGNGSSNTIADYDEGNSVIELSPSLKRLAVWAPSNWVQLNDDDWDLGSGGPIQVPGTSYLFVSGKPSDSGAYGYLMTEGKLGGIGKGAFTGLVCTSGGVFGADASDVLGSGAKAKTMIYAPCGGGTEGLLVDTAKGTFSRVWSPSVGEPDGPPIVAGGVVWALAWDGSQLYGMNPATGHVVVQRATDELVHFATPAAGDGMLLVPTAGGVEAFKTVG